MTSHPNTEPADQDLTPADQRMVNAILSELRKLSALAAQMDGSSAQMLPDAIAKRAVEIVHQLTADDVAAWLPDETGIAWQIAAHVGLRPEYAASARVTEGDSVTGYVIQHRTPIELDPADLTTSPVPFKYAAEAQQEGWQSILIVPLHTVDDAHAMGTLSVYNRQGKHLAEWKQNLLGIVADQVATAIEFGQLLARERELRASQTHLIQIGQKMAQESVGELRSVLASVVDSARDLTGADYAVIYPYNPESRHSYNLEHVVMSGITEQPLLKDKPRVGGVAELVRQAGELIVSAITETHAEIRSVPVEGVSLEQQERLIINANFVKREGVRAFVGISLHANRAGEEAEQEVGILYIDYTKPHHFTEAELNLIRLFASQAAIAIQNAELFQKERQLRQQADQLRTISGAITQNLDLRQVSGQILDSLQEVIEYDSAYMQIIENDQRIQVAGRGAFADDPVPPWAQKPISADRLISQVFSDRNPLILSSVANSPNWDIQPETEHIQSWIGLPLFYHDDPIGLLTLEHRTPGYYTPALNGVLTLFANQAAIAIQNANLFGKENRRRKGFELLQRITRRISAAENLRDTLEEIVAGASQLSGAMACTLQIVDAGGEELHELIGQPKSYAILGSSLEEFTQAVMDGGEPFAVPNAGTSDNMRELLDDYDVESLIGMPIKTTRATIGVLTLYFGEPRNIQLIDEPLIQALVEHAAVAVVNASLLEQRSRDIAALEAVNRAMTENGAQRVIELIAQKANELTDSEYTTLWRLNTEENRLDVGAVFGRPILKQTSDVTIGTNGWVIRNGEPYLCSDAATDPHYAVWYDDIRSTLTVPLRIHGGVIGTLHVESTQIDHYSQYQLVLLQSLADQGAIAIENAQRYERQIEQIAAQSAIISEALDRPEVGEMLQHIVEQAIEAVQGEYAELWLLDTKTNDLIIGAAMGPAAERVRNLGRLAENGEVQYTTGGKGVNRYVVEHREPYICRDTKRDKLFIPVWEDARSSVTVPLRYGERILGSLSVESSRKHAFTKDHAGLLDQLTDQAATAIEVQRRLERRLAALEAVRVFQQAISIVDASVEAELDNIYTTAATILGDIGIDTDNLYIALIEHDSAGQDWITFPLAYEGGERVDQTVEPLREPGKVQYERREFGKRKGLTEWVVRHKVSLLIEQDFDQWAARQPDIEVFNAGTKCWLGAPILYQNAVIGVIGLQNFERAEVFEPYHRDVLEAIAGQIAIVIHNARLYAIVNTAARRLEKLNEIYEEVIAADITELDAIYLLLYNAAERLMNLDDAFFYIARYDAESELISFPFVLEKEQGKSQPTNKQSLATRQRSAKEWSGLTEYVIDNRKPILFVEDFDHQVTAAGLVVFPGIGYKNRPTRSWLGVPMLVRGKVIGVMSIQDLERPRAFTEEHATLLQAVANQAAIALENAQLYKNLEDQQQALISQQEQLTARNQLMTLGTATATLQHRINNSFNIIVPNVERLRKRVDLSDPETVEILDIIDRNARSTSELIERIQKPLKEQTRQMIDLNGLLSDVIRSVEERWSTDNHNAPIRFTFESEDEVPPFEAPSGQVAEVFTNLMDNACRAMQNGGTLSIKAANANSVIHVRVQDDGPGIPDNIRDRLFKIPVRGSSGGSGLGMWLCQLILQSLGGSVTIEDTGSHGTTVLVEIPLQVNG